ncbi:hypothetical protein [Streptomyces sp. Root369]|uniref:hypothetical protein n=1 Tax=Streptomyces sp. Root369 TaxID=1736523 RepID=UPI00070D109B|nr:hypothetical protein [Streptomyces sp. Root369]KQW11433.1 hypothetical protein ASD08_35780 [Streptomyces sp. Root369]
MPDCRHQLDLCPDCAGLRVVEMTRVDVTDIRFDGPAGHFVPRGPATVYIGPVPGPCPNVSSEETRDVRRD